MSATILLMVMAVARRMTAGEQLRAGRKLQRFPQLIIGLVGYGTSLTFLVESALGAASWNVLSEGIALQTGLTFGWATNLTSVVVLLFWIPLRELPGVGTVLNVLLVGTSADLAAHFVHAPSSLQQQVIYFAVGLAMLTFSDGSTSARGSAPGQGTG
jgi:uncharacterized membrane protein YczE